MTSPAPKRIRAATRSMPVRGLLPLLAFTAVALGPVSAAVAAPDHVDPIFHERGGFMTDFRGGMAAATSSADDGQRCTGDERQQALRAEQSRVLALVGDLRVLDSEADLARLAVPDPESGTAYGVYPHMFASLRGMGVAILNAGPEVGPGKPDLLLYRPSPRAADVLDPFGPDFAYELAGWAYTRDYFPGEPPAFPGDPGLRCLAGEEWFVHERSVHPADTWQNIPVPPAEKFHGQATGNQPPLPHECQPPCAGVPHGRLWDIHIWAGESGVPRVSMLNPGRPIPGSDPQVGTGFFFPGADG